ncbi:MAG: hypothetical protein J6M34_05115 [Clostridia bacterium]|nr:hypothetical protein [Clostridia bacterium]
MGRRMLTGIFFAVLLALLVWAAVTGMIGNFLRRTLNALEADGTGVSSAEDVLFDDDSTVDWSEPDQDVFVESLPSEESSAPKTYEFALTKDYFAVLLEQYSAEVPIRNLTAEFSDGQVIFSGGADVPVLSELLKIPSALVMFLPKTVDCNLYCVPEVSEGRLKVTVVKVTAGSDIISPFLQGEGVLTAVEDFLNDLLTKYLPSHYKMQSATVSDGGLYVRFLIGKE